MNSTSHIIKLVFVLCIGCCFAACEDDPLLEGPNNGKPAGGSYGRLGVPDSTGNYPAPPVIYDPSNPEVF